MAKVDFAVKGARSAMDRLPRAETENAMNWTSWLPLRALSGWTAKDLDGGDRGYALRGALLLDRR
ncbi:hypothetical protein RFM99_01510 [Mesorhizobium sp. VK4C]|uniref:hypothetical protein n=1 Tax=Mesorhizobium captivum TaxID=3072319 RepID=UPI002A243BB6|nr:hypothetical protein [Mesorhizobium sp. VK4C]MDX8497084.1 hypothetical protein [Mesorhizobium sp. VK4C]